MCVNYIPKELNQTLWSKNTDIRIILSPKIYAKLEKHFFFLCTEKLLQPHPDMTQN